MSSYYTTAVDGKTVHVIKTDPGDIVPRLIQDTIGDSNYDGINAGYFSSLSQMLSMAIYRTDGTPSPVCSGANENYYSRGTLFFYTYSLYVNFDVLQSYTEIQKWNDLLWAVGGLSMLLYQNLQDANDYNNALDTEYGKDKFDWDTTRPRSGMGYDSTGQVYLFGVDKPNGMTLWEMRNASIAIGCEEAINLDGGGSSQLKYSTNGFQSSKDTSVPVIVGLSGR